MSIQVVDESYFLAICIEGFLYGKPCGLTCTLAKKSSYSGVYSGIFAMYLKCQCPSKRSGTALILFYAVCLLYVLCIAAFVSDLVAVILQVSNNSIRKNTIFLSVVQTRFSSLSPQLQIDSLPMLIRISIIQSTVGGCCDFLAQCILVRISHCTCHPLN